MSRTKTWTQCIKAGGTVRGTSRPLHIQDRTFDNDWTCTRKRKAVRSVVRTKLYSMTHSLWHEWYSRWIQANWEVQASRTSEWCEVKVARRGRKDYWLGEIDQRVRGWVNSGCASTHQGEARVCKEHNITRASSPIRQPVKPLKETKTSSGAPNKASTGNCWCFIFGSCTESNQ